ncbi:glutathione S-transferase family protein [Crocosphaera sp.]|uniref:glutathione S-transferase family protein n=1 Tax=Crocosphaera sp. TaxID=2729996 RepID=UPI0026028FD1|nr:glutathione S-transferase family protein [Crocosphaera sp.]MDJ0581491.1 glutathione S-transferase family protein [Crocosphaera sp.]
MSNQSVIPPWEELLEKSKNKTNVKWEIRAGQTPSNVAISSYFNCHSYEGKPQVLLYRDTNAWCPFCERVWLALEEKQIPFEVELIDLRNKPKWYTDLVPTGLVPAVKIDGELVYESKSILLSLEENFTKHGLLPEDKQEKEIALEMIEACEKGNFSRAGYQFLLGKPLNSTIEDLSEKELIAELQENFETQLNQLEKALEKYPSDYFMRDFGLVDIMYIPSIERLAANLPTFRGYHLLGNEKYPLLNRWLKAMNKRPNYQRIKSDARTHNLVMKNVFKLEPLSQELQVMEDEQENNSQQDRLEAAAKLSDNHENVVQDILKNSGIKSWITDENLEQVEEYINLYMRFLANQLLQNYPIPLADEQLMKNNEIAVIGAVSLSYIRNRVCVPRDLTAGAASQFKEAIDKILKCLYSSAF